MSGTQIRRERILQYSVQTRISEWRQMLILVPTYTAYVSSRHYTRTDIAPAASLQRFQKTQQQLIKSICNTHAKVHFTFDLGTSPNHRAFLGIVAYWIGPQHFLQSTVLRMKRFRGFHTGENQTLHFWNVVVTYHLREKIEGP